MVWRKEASRVAIFGASGYTGGELLRLVDGHPKLEPVYLGAHSRAGDRLGEVHPQLPGPERVLGPIDANMAPPMDLAFLALPHGESWKLGSDLAGRGIKVVDLGSDFRLDTPDRYQQAYGTAHPLPDELADWVYGLPELFGPAIAESGRVAAPGCYPTSVVLALAPLLNEGLIEEEGLVVSSISGVTGAGRNAKPELSFGSIAEGVRAYGVARHRHRPEMEAALEEAVGVPVSVTFTPHLVPMQRGILSTCYGRITEDADASELRDALCDAYADAPFVDVIDEPPQTRWVTGSNRCLIAAYVDDATGTAVVLSAIDNLVKGAAGQAIQCANLMLGHAEAEGLAIAGLLP